MPGQLQKPIVDSTLFAVLINRLQYEIKHSDLTSKQIGIIQRALLRAEVMDQLFVQVPVKCRVLNIPCVRIIARPVYEDLLKAIKVCPEQAVEIVHLLVFQPEVRYAS